MRIVIDTSEQAPWNFNNFDLAGVDIVRRTLPTGDYTVEGSESLICVERKSLDDLVKTVVTDWMRFSRELRRMAAMDVAVIVVEAPVTALLQHQYDSNVNPASVRGKLNRILLDFGVPTMFLENRSIAAEWVLNLFQQWHERD